MFGVAVTGMLVAFPPQLVEAIAVKHGGKTIIFARFIPFARTFAPFVAGAGSMDYKYFLSYNVIGGFLWIASFVLLGYFFGNQPVIKDNFTYVIFGIIGFSVLPVIFSFINQKLKKTA